MMILIILGLLLLFSGIIIWKKDKIITWIKKNWKKVLSVILIGGLTASSLILYPPIEPPSEDFEWIIDGDTVYTNNTKFYASATPHTLSSSGWVIFEGRSKTFSGAVDFTWGFNGTNTFPSRDIYIWRNYSHPNGDYEFYEDYGCRVIYNITDFQNLGIENYDNYIVHEGTKNNTYLFNATFFDDDEGMVMTRTFAFTTYQQVGDGDDYRLCGNYSTARWIWDNLTYFDWKKIDLDFQKENYNFKNMTNWYYIKNQDIISGKTYKIKCWIDVEFGGLNGVSGKYWWAFKPSSETLQQAINNDHLFYLDPWWDSDWDYYKVCNVNNKHEGVQMKIIITNTSGYSPSNVSCESHAQSDFDDIRFVNTDNSTLYDYWRENYTSDLYATYWVNNSDNASQILMYYGNPQASYTGVGKDTFPLFEGCEDGDTDEWYGAYGTITISAETDSNYVYTGSYSIEFYEPDTTSNAGAYYPISMQENQTLQYRFYPDDFTGDDWLFIFHDGSSSGHWTNKWFEKGAHHFYFSGTDSGQTITKDKWYRYEVNNFDWSAMTNDQYVYNDDNSLWDSATGVTSQRSPPFIKIWQYQQKWGTGSPYGRVYYDNIFTCNVWDPMPHWSSFSSENSNAPTPNTYSTTIRTDGIDYFVWLGENTTASEVADLIDDEDEITFGDTSEYIGIWNKSKEWHMTTHHWSDYCPSDESGDNFNVNTYDVIRIKVSDDNGDCTFIMTENSDIDYSNSREVTLTTLATGRTLVGWTNTSMLTGSDIANTKITTTLDNGEIIYYWNETNYNWDYYIVGFYEPILHVYEDDVLMIAVLDEETIQIGGK